MRKRNLLAILAIVLALVGCEGRTDKTDGGGVLLSVSDFTGLPQVVSVNTALTNNGVFIDSITIQSVTKDINGATSSLMNVELESYEVTYTRGDTGTRLPANLVRTTFGVVPVNGTRQETNLLVLTAAQLDEIPLSDLQFVNGGFDRETGESVITLNIQVRYFGRTLSGDQVETAPIEFTVDFVS